MTDFSKPVVYQFNSIPQSVSPSNTYGGRFNGFNIDNRNTYYWGALNDMAALEGKYYYTTHIIVPSVFKAIDLNQELNRINKTKTCNKHKLAEACNSYPKGAIDHCHMRLDPFPSHAGACNQHIPLCTLILDKPLEGLCPNFHDEAMKAGVGERALGDLICVIPPGDAHTPEVTTDNSLDRLCFYLASEDIPEADGSPESPKEKIERAANPSGIAVHGYFMLPLLLTDMSVVYAAVPNIEEKRDILESYLKHPTNTPIALNDGHVEAIEELHNLFCGQIAFEASSTH